MKLTPLVAITSALTIASAQAQISGCFDLDVTNQSGPLGSSLADDSIFNVRGSLSNPTNPNMGPLVGTELNFNTEVGVFGGGSTTASYNNGMLGFTGSVNLTPDPAFLTMNIPGHPDCKIRDFSFNTCVTIDEGSNLYKAIRELEASKKTVYFGQTAGGVKEETKTGSTLEESGPKEEPTAATVKFSDAFKYNEKTKSFEYDSSRMKNAGGFFYKDERGNDVAIRNANDDVITIIKDFTVCIDCTTISPEPSSAMLLGLGSLGLILRRRR